MTTDPDIDYLDFDPAPIPCQSRNNCKTPASFRIRFEKHEHVADQWWFACAKHAYGTQATCPHKPCGKPVKRVEVVALP